MNRLRFTVPSALVALASLGTGTSAHAAPAGWEDYTVKPGDTCAGIAQRVYGDSTRYDLIHDGNPGLGAPPHNLQPGTILHLPPKPATTPDAHLTAMRNVVQVNANPGHVHDPLFRGNRVETQAAASADIEFRDTTDLELSENTLVVIFGNSASRASQTRTSADATLVSGRLRAHLAELAGHAPGAAVHTESGVATLGAGEAQLHVDETHTTRLAVYQGRSDLTAKKKTVHVDQGFGSKAVAGKAPTPPRPLPAAPVWSTPFPPLVLATADTDIAGGYAAGSGPGDPPASWHVELARDDRFRNVVVDARVPLGVVRLEGKGVKPGTYFARVSAVDADKFEGAFGPVARVVVASVNVRPQPHHASLLEIAPAGLACAVGTAPLTPISSPLPADRHEPETLRCGLAASDSTPATLALAAEPFGPVTIETRWVREDQARREGDVAVDVLDADNAPVPRPLARITPVGAGVVVLSVDRDPSGTGYLAHVRWSATTTACAFQVKVGDLDQVSSTQLAVAPPVAAASMPVPRAAEPSLWEVGIGGGLVATSVNASGYAPRFEGGFDGKLPLGPGVLRVGAGGSLESAPTWTSQTMSLLGLALDLGYRWGREQPRLAPYVRVAPQLLTQTSGSAAGAGGHATWLGLSGTLGLELRAGHGAAYLEGGYRTMASAKGRSDAASTDGAVFTLGYRLAL